MLCENTQLIQLSYLDKNMGNLFVKHRFFMQFYRTYGETAEIWVTITFSNGLYMCYFIENA